MSDKHEDEAMTRVRQLHEASGMSLQALGVAMGYDPEIARQSAFQFMKTADPRISMLRRFAKAHGLPLAALVDDVKKKRARS